MEAQAKKLLDYLISADSLEVVEAEEGWEPSSLVYLVLP